jgi:ribosomal protein L37AE/L43A
MSIYCPLSKALGIEYIPSDGSTYNPLEKEFDPSYMGNRGAFNAFYGKKHTEETKQIIREKRAKQVISEETRAKMSETRKGRKLTWNLKNNTPEANAKRSVAMKDRIYHKVECPHCGKLGHYAAMGRWHFDNCKEKR